MLPQLGWQMGRVVRRTCLTRHISSMCPAWAEVVWPLAHYGMANYFSLFFFKKIAIYRRWRVLQIFFFFHKTPNDDETSWGVAKKLQILPPIIKIAIRGLFAIFFLQKKVLLPLINTPSSLQFHYSLLLSNSLQFSIL